METKDAPISFGSAVALELKALPEDGTFEGYASVYGNVDQGGDIVRAGAFDASLRQRPANRVKMLLQHESREIIGSWDGIASDGKGLFVRGKLLLSVKCGAETYERMKIGQLDGMSIGYRCTEDEYDSVAQVRTIVRADLMEVSLVTFPMNPQATVTGVKSAEEIKTIREFEDFLRDAGGFSNARAKAIASHGFKSAEPRDEDAQVIIDLKQLAEHIRRQSS